MCSSCIGGGGGGGGSSSGGGMGNVHKKYCTTNCTQHVWVQLGAKIKTTRDGEKKKKRAPKPDC